MLVMRRHICTMEVELKCYPQRGYARRNVKQHSRNRDHKLMDLIATVVLDRVDSTMLTSSMSNTAPSGSARVPVMV